MQELGQRLREVRTARRASLETVSRGAKISPAYLHKLEAGRVRSPSPHVLRRLAEALEVPYATLMELAGYIDRGEITMAPATSSSTAPTNAEIVRLLEALTREVAEIKELLRKIGER